MKAANSRLAHDRFGCRSGFGLARHLAVLLAPFLFLLVSLISGCTNSSIATARSEIALGRYAAAHQMFVQAAANPKLSPREQREVADGLCLTEYKIGAPQYSLSRQYQACAAAVDQPGSASRPIFDQLATAKRAQYSQQAAAAIRNRDFVEAENAIARYKSLPDADSRLLSVWSRQLWVAVEHDDSRTNTHSHALAIAISQLTRQYPRVNAMSVSAFRQWIKDNMTISGTPMASDVKIGKRSVDLWIPDNHVALAQFNLDRFARVNNALVARCRCDARTNIAMQGSGLPAYLVRLDPATRQSEILILAQP